VPSVTETKRVTDFFLLLGEDESLRGAFDRDPRGLLERSGLDAKAVQTVLAGDLETVRATVEEELAGDPDRRRLLVTPRMHVEVPGPEPDEPDEPEPDEPDEPED